MSARLRPYEEIAALALIAWVAYQANKTPRLEQLTIFDELKRTHSAQVRPFREVNWINETNEARGVITTKTGPYVTEICYSLDEYLPGRSQANTFCVKGKNMYYTLDPIKK